MKYKVVLQHSDEGVSVSVPGLPGCWSQGADETEAIANISSGQRTGKLATVRRDGRPHVTPVWFVVEGNALVLMTHETSLKGKSLQRDPRAMVSVDEEEFPYAFVLVEGVAEVERPPAVELLRWSRRIAERYVPRGYVDATASRNATDGELLIRVPMEKVTGMRDVAA
jgi:PPOX class probable F420-dependent enzyme